MPRPELLFFCRNLKTLRQVCGYSKGKMARTCGIGCETLSRLERGEVPPRRVRQCGSPLDTRRPIGYTTTQSRQTAPGSENLCVDFSG